MTLEDPPFSRVGPLTPAEAAAEQNTREGLRALFYWAVFPFPLALIPLAWLSRLPFVGLLAGVAGLVVLIVWAMRARAAWGDKLAPLIARAWDAIWALALTGYQKVSRGTQSESPATVSSFAALEEVEELPTVEWKDPPKHDDHAWYRTEYEKLVRILGSLPRGVDHENAQDRRRTMLYLAEILDGLHNYGDDPLAPPAPNPPPAPAPRPMGFVSLAAPRVQFWPIVAAVAVAIGLVQTLRVERVKNDARDLQDAVAAETDRANAAETQARMNEVALESSRHEVNVSRELNETLQARQERLEARQRRSSREQVDAARGGRPVDLDGRLRELTLQPFASPDLGASPAADPAGGMHERPAGALDLSTPGALPTGDDGASARDSNVPG